MRRKVLHSRFWLVIAWRAIARLLSRLPRQHPARPYLHALSRGAENLYWRRVRTRLRAR